MSDALQELKGLLTEISTSQKTVKEKVEAMEARQAQLEERIGKTRDEVLTELENKGIPTVRKPQERLIAIPGAEPGGPEAKKIHFGYDLGKQAIGLKNRLQKKGENEWLNLIEPHTMIEDDAHREEYAKYIINVVKARFGDPRAMAQLVEAREKDLAEGTGGQGGYLVPEEFTAEILAFARLQSLALKYCRIWPMSTDMRNVPVESTGVTTSWKNEAEALSQSEPVVGEVSLVARRLGAYAVCSDDLLSDSAIDIVSWLTELFAEAIGQEIDNQVFNGNGTPCSGILTAACGYSVVMDSGLTSFSSITGTNLSEMISKLSANKRAGARFFAEKLTMHYIRTLKDTNGQFLFAQIGGGVPGTIWGFPYDETEQITGTSAADTPFVSFGDLRYFALGRRLQSMTLRADPYTKFLEDQTRFKIVNRWGMKIGLAGAFVRLLTAAE